jgi:sulfide dehydrogenase cytochrome subunit
MKKYFVFFVFFGMLSLTANDYITNKAQMLALSCSSCHGTDGISTSTMPHIGGKSKEYLYKTLKDFKSGKRPGTIMRKHVKGFTDKELKQIAHYYSTMGGN